MRVLIVLPNVVSGGAERLNLDLAASLSARGVQTDVFSWTTPYESLPPGVRSELAARGVNVLHGRTGAIKMRYELPLIFLRLVRVARRYDVLVGGLELHSTYLAAAVARLLGKPVIGEVQTPLEYVMRAGERLLGALARLTYPRLDAVVAVSEGVAHGVRTLRVPEARIIVINNGIDFARVDALRDASPALEQSSPLVVAVGRLVDQKGFDLLIRAHAEVLQCGPSHSLLIVGEGPERARLQALIEDCGVSESVALPGFLANPYPAVVGAALFCMPSRREGFPLALLEALHLGVPIVAADCASGPAEILAGGRFGDLVRPESVDDLVEAISAHLRDPERLRAKAREGREQASSFSVERVADQYVGLFERLLSRAVTA